MFDSYVDINDEICQTGEVPKWNYNPKYTGFSNHCQHGTNIPGKFTTFFYNLCLISIKAVISTIFYGIFRVENVESAGIFI